MNAISIPQLELLEARSDGKVVLVRCPAGLSVIEKESALQLANNILKALGDK